MSKMSRRRRNTLTMAIEPGGTPKRATKGKRKRVPTEKLIRSMRAMRANAAQVVSKRQWKTNVALFRSSPTQIELLGSPDELLLLISNALLKIGAVYGKALRLEVFDQSSAGSAQSPDDVFYGLTPMCAADTIDFLNNVEEATFNV